jgi:polyphosphate kinase
MRLALGLRSNEVMQVVPPLDLRFVERIVEEGPAHARFEQDQVQRAGGLDEATFESIDRGDVLLVHPYQSYGAVEAFASAAAADPAVTAIRATLYRVGDENVLATSLVAAARAGKDVAVLLEGRARFDELTNLEWALRFRNSGVRVLRLPAKKVHAKLCWVQRGESAYLHVGTGNYHPTNGRRYSDISLFTRSEHLARDAKAFFDALEAGTAPNLRVMRTGAAIRDVLLERIRAEGHPGGHVILKSNHLTDPDILAALHACGAAGARVDLIVRTTLVSVSPHVHARCVVGRFLEHARAVAFQRDGGWEVWCGSFDAMPRNFERRYEIMFPVEDARAKRAILQELTSQLRDDVNAYELRADGTEEPRWGGSYDCQSVLGRHLSRVIPAPEAKEADLGAEAGGAPESAADGSSRAR